MAHEKWKWSSHVVSTRADWIVEVLETDEGFSVGCPALPGCFSQGDTRAEALANIRDAIQEYLAAQRPHTRQ